MTDFVGSLLDYFFITFLDTWQDVDFVEWKALLDIQVNFVFLGQGLLNFLRWCTLESFIEVRRF